MMTKRPLFKRRRHVARSARILSTGISATAILAMTAAYAAAEQVPSNSDSGSTTVATPPTSSSSVDGLATPQNALVPLQVASPSPVGAASTVTPSLDGASAKAAVGQTPVATVDPSAVVTPDTLVAQVVAPIDTVAPITPIETVAPLITVTPITAAPAPVQLQIPKSSPASTSGGSR